MEKQDASKLIACLFEAQTRLADAAELAKALQTKEEANSLRRTIANAIGTIAADAIAPILQLYPELDPYPKDVGEKDDDQ